ncbi:MAG: hypothetical protein AAF078_02155 [Planctomycetota bacterium]
MMPREIKDLLDREPFKPVRFHMTDGSVHEVRRSDLAYVTQTDVMLGLEPDEDGLASRSKYLNVRQISQVEVMSDKPAA